MSDLDDLKRAYSLVGGLRFAIEATELRLEKLGYRGTAKSVYDLRLRCSEIIAELPPLPNEPKPQHTGSKEP